MTAMEATPAQTASPASAPKPKRTRSEILRGNKRAEKPQVVKTQVIAKHLNGESKSQIARDLDLSRPTVRNILEESEVSSIVEAGRSDCVGLVPDAVSGLKHGIVDKRDWRASATLLRGVGVLTSGPTVVVQTNVYAETWVAMRKAREQERLETPGIAPAIETSAIVPTSPDSESK